MRPVEVRSDSGKADPQLIAEFEHLRNIELPAAYKALISAHNFLYPQRKYFNFKNIFADTEAWSYHIADGIDDRDLTFLGFGEGVSRFSQIEEVDLDIFGHDNVVPFGVAANGDYICFDYREDPQGDVPKVVVMFHDAFDRDNKMLLCFVASSFEEFMDGLHD